MRRGQKINVFSSSMLLNLFHNVIRPPYQPYCLSSNQKPEPVDRDPRNSCRWQRPPINWSLIAGLIPQTSVEVFPGRKRPPKGIPSVFKVNVRKRRTNSKIFLHVLENLSFQALPQMGLKGSVNSGIARYSFPYPSPYFRVIVHHYPANVGGGGSEAVKASWQHVRRTRPQLYPLACPPPCLPAFWEQQVVRQESAAAVVFCCNFATSR